MKQYNFKEGLSNRGLWALSRTIPVFLLFSSAVTFSSCGDQDLSEQDFAPYEGPVSIIENIELIFSDSAKAKVKLLAKKQFEYTNGDRHFPEGVYIEFYNREEILETTLQANSGTLDGETNIYTVVGDVKIRNILQDKSLFSEELHWNPATEKIYTDKNVIIVQDGEKITGTGLEASQDFENYEIKNPKGSFAIEAEDEID
jgi:LPS export ABC transporter protein LptC